MTILEWVIILILIGVLLIVFIHTIGLRVSFKIDSVIHSKINISMNSRIRVKFSMNIDNIIRLRTRCS